MKFKSTLKIFAIMFAASFILSGCWDDSGAGNSNPNPGESVPAKFVSKAALIDALWGLSEEPNPDAEKVASSTFIFAQENPIMIIRSVEPTELNTTPVAIVASLNLGTYECGYNPTDPTSGVQLWSWSACTEKYLVTADEESPIDIELAESLGSKQSLESKARRSPTPYPSTGCVVEANFEKHGWAPVPVEPEEEEVTEEESETPEEEEEEEVSAMTVNADIPGEEEDGDEEDPSEEEEQTPPSDVPHTYSLKLVITKYDCSQGMGYVQQPGSGSPVTKP